jgi:carbamoyl-phosphate synthase large subunit
MSTIVVTGVGAIIGYGILRSLRAAGTHRLIGTDITAHPVGTLWSDVFERAPLTASVEYTDWLIEIWRRHKADLVIPGIKQDVARFAAAQSELERHGIRVALNDPSLIALCSDKWHLYQSLSGAFDDVRIPTRDRGTYEELAGQFGVPFVLKLRRGHAKKGFMVVSTAAEFGAVSARLGADLIAQPLVGTDDAEFTVGAFGDGHGGVAASITFRRLLAADGSTGKAWVEKAPSLEAVVARLARRFKPRGPTNLQFRRDGDEWKLLEINPRISSSTSIRTAFGYNESAMCVDYYLNGRLPEQPAISTGFAVRYIEDLIVHERGT